MTSVNKIAKVHLGQTGKNWQSRYSKLKTDNKVFGRIQQTILIRATYKFMFIVRASCNSDNQISTMDTPMPSRSSIASP